MYNNLHLSLKLYVCKLRDGDFSALYKRSLGFSFSHQVVIFISESSVNLLLLSSLINSEGLRQILRL